MGTQRKVEIDRIDRDPDQPRKLFAQDALDELATSIAEIGVQQPVSLRYRPAERRYTLISGERRWRAAKQAGLTELPAMVQGEMADEEAFVRAIAENVVREDMTPMEEANAFARLVHEFGWDVDRIASKFGKSGAYIQWRVDLLGLIPTAQEALNKAQLPVGLAWYVCRLEPDQQSNVLRRWVRGDFKGFREAEAYCQALRDAAASTQQGFFAMEEESEEKRAQVQERQKRAISDLERLERAGVAVGLMITSSPEDLARFLATAPGSVRSYADRLDVIAKQIKQLQGLLRKAQAIQQVAPEINEHALAA